MSKLRHDSIAISSQKSPLPESVIQNIEKVIGLQNKQAQDIASYEKLL